MPLDGFGNAWPMGDTAHGTLTSIFAVGKTVGIARNANLVFVPVLGSLDVRWPYEKDLETLVAIANDLEGKPVGTAAIFWSLGVLRGSLPDWYFYTWGE